MAISAINWPIFQIWVLHQTRVGFCHPGAAKTAKKHASFKIWPTARKRQKNHQKLKKMVKKNILRKSAIFQPFDERDCQAAWLFAHWANLVAKRALGQRGQIHPISTCI
jgi:hypothetical protein